ncbi:MAG TPA: hypothetical protein H9756_02325 [Candidatus Mediterraneibacter gallistercoris]|uniref:Uncharacterized protein n=1 Tax=Candidatus Mediterraneibacter gallistercoris TaxID=2838671 RepID=A0A9D2P1P9_9FIRM|nr:hypothetical protein [Candidatus Mediterraneibacter gallistercoris]
MEYKAVQNLVTQLMILVQLLSRNTTLEPLVLVAQEAENVYETEYTRDSVDNKITEYLDILFYDNSHISVIADPESYTLEIIPASSQDYAGERLITIKKKN